MVTKTNYIRRRSPCSKFHISNEVSINRFVFCSSSCRLADRSLLFSWNRYTPPIRFGSTSSPTGFNVGGDSQIAILFLEIKYGDSVTSPDSSNGFDVHITRVRYFWQFNYYQFIKNIYIFVIFMQIDQPMLHRYIHFWYLAKFQPTQIVSIC